MLNYSVAELRVDTKKNKGWIESSDMGNIFVSVIGENYVEHDMKK